MRVYILLTDTSSVLTKLIKMYTKKPYNHASLAFDERLEYTYSFGRLNPDNPFIGGFTHERLDLGVFKSARCVLYSLDVTHNQYKKMREKVSKMEMDKEKYKYNFIGLFGTITKREFKRKNAYFCSEFVSKVLQDAGLFPEDLPPFLVKPDDIAKYLDVRVEYQGSLCEYLETIGFVSLNSEVAGEGMVSTILYVPFRIARFGTNRILSSGRYLNESRRQVMNKFLPEDPVSRYFRNRKSG